MIHLYSQNSDTPFQKPQMDVKIYVESRREHVYSISRLELASKSRFLSSLLGSVSLCDGCQESVALVVTGYTSEDVMAALGQFAHFRKPRLTIIQG